MPVQCWLIPRNALLVFGGPRPWRLAPSISAHEVYPLRNHTILKRMSSLSRINVLDLSLRVDGWVVSDYKGAFECHTAPVKILGSRIMSWNAKKGAGIAS